MSGDGKCNKEKKNQGNGVGEVKDTAIFYRVVREGPSNKVKFKQRLWKKWGRKFCGDLREACLGVAGSEWESESGGS